MFNIQIGNFFVFIRKVNAPTQDRTEDLLRAKQT